MSSRTGSQTDSREEGQEQEDFRDWAALPAQVLQHVLQHDPTTALRRPARAVCSSWRAAVNAHVQQAYCDVADVALLQNFTGLKSVIIDEVDFFGRLMRQRQQRRWALPKQQQPQIPQPFIPLDPISSTTVSSTTTISSSSISHRPTRPLRQTPLAQHLADLGRIEIFNPPDLDLAPLEQLPGLQDVTLRCIHLVRRLPLHTEHLGHVTSLTLQQMHTTTGTRRVDGLPEALLQLHNLRRLALIGIRRKSAAQVLEPPRPFVHPSLYDMAQHLAGTAGGGDGSRLSMPARLQQQLQPADGPGPEGSQAVQQDPLFVLAHILEEHVGLLDITGEAHASSGTAAAAAASAAAAIQAAADAVGPSSMGVRRPLPPRTLPCPWLGNLQCLVLRSCGLNALPAAALVSLRALTSLDLSNNSLPLLPYDLRYLKQLQVLILDNNTSMRRDEEGIPWCDLSELTHLSLSSCPSLMGPLLALSQLVGLQRLGASGNGPAPVGASLAGCTALKVLDVRGTRIGRSLSAALIHQLPALQRCLYGPRSGGRWVAAVHRAAAQAALVQPTGLEMVHDQAWLGIDAAQKDQDFWAAKDCVDHEASSSSGGSSEEEEEVWEESSSSGDEWEDGSESGGSDEMQAEGEAADLGLFLLHGE